MYVCICNVVTEDDVYGCMASGCRTAKEVKAACGFKPGCGMCTKRIHQMVSRYRTAGDIADAVTGGPAALAAVPAPDAPPASAGRDVPVRFGPDLTEPDLTEPDIAEGGTAPQTAA